MRNFRKLILAATLGLLVFSSSAQAQIFTGTFGDDDDVAFFTLNVFPSAPVNQTFLTTVKTTSWATGGFDPILTLFDSTGTLIDFNDDVNVGVPVSEVAADPLLNQRRDSYIQIELEPGTYTIALSQYDNFADPLSSAPLLLNRFERNGQPFFTSAFVQGAPGITAPFVASNGLGTPGTKRNGSFAVSAVVAPEPASLALVAGLLPVAVVAVRRRRK